MTGKSIHHLRENYDMFELLEGQIPENPINLFATWFEQAQNADIQEPNAMHVCTMDKNNRPSSRVILLKEWNDKGFVFFTNYHSAKGEHIEHNPAVCMTFFWLPLQRQVHIHGLAQKISAEDSDTYFKTRPRRSQIGAWASLQSQEVTHEQIQERAAKYEAQFEGVEVPRPPHWGGYLITPDAIEFWQGRPGRMHDRIMYIKENEQWTTKRLAP